MKNQWDLGYPQSLTKARVFFISWFTGIIFRFRVEGTKKKILKAFSKATNPPCFCPPIL